MMIYPLYRILAILGDINYSWTVRCRSSFANSASANIAVVRGPGLIHQERTFIHAMRMQLLAVVRYKPF